MKQTLIGLLLTGLFFSLVFYSCEDDSTTMENPLEVNTGVLKSGTFYQGRDFESLPNYMKNRINLYNKLALDLGERPFIEKFGIPDTDIRFIYAEGRDTVEMYYIRNEKETPTYLLTGIRRGIESGLYLIGSKDEIIESPDIPLKPVFLELFPVNSPTVLNLGDLDLGALPPGCYELYACLICEDGWEVMAVPCPPVTEIEDDLGGGSSWWPVPNPGDPGVGWPDPDNPPILEPNPPDPPANMAWILHVMNISVQFHISMAEAYYLAANEELLSEIQEYANMGNENSSAETDINEYVPGAGAGLNPEQISDIQDHVWLHMNFPGFNPDGHAIGSEGWVEAVIDAKLQIFVTNQSNSEDAASYADAARELINQDPTIKVDRLVELYEKVKEDPFFLVGCPPETYPDWMDLFGFVPPQSCYDKVSDLNESQGTNSLTGKWGLRPFYQNNAAGAVVNLDYYSITIDTMPSFNGQTISKEDFLDTLRLNLSDFAGTPFNPVFPEDDALWLSENPLTTVLTLPVLLPKFKPKTTGNKVE